MTTPRQQFRICAAVKLNVLTSTQLDFPKSYGRGGRGKKGTADGIRFWEDLFRVVLLRHGSDGLFFLVFLRCLYTLRHQSIVNQDNKIHRNNTVIQIESPI